MRIKANIYHHTHWDNEWYFTEEDSLVQLTYHMKELLEALEKNIIDYFYLDGQTAILEDYLELHKEDQERVKILLQKGKLFVGPFHTQIDSFITSGESIINNLRYGMNTANFYGGTSKVAYLPDSFGQSQDYPKIFQQLGIASFVFRRGMGDEHKLPIDFIFSSNDGSSVVTTTLYCGYGFATDPFIKKTLTCNAGLDYDGKDITGQLKKLAVLSTIENEFLLPIGNDQTPVIWNFKELMQSYQDDKTYEFIETTLATYMEKLKENKNKLKVYQGEFINPQYHRVHRSIYSARMDIKNLQDKLERLMALEIQPIMTILDDLSLHYDEKLINRIWNLLGRSQTHSGATNTDKTNNLILKRTEKAYNLAIALKVYLIRKIAITLPIEQLPIVFFNTLPYERTMNLTLDLYTKKDTFTLKYKKASIPYTLLSQEKIYGGVVRKDQSHYDTTLYYYKSTVVVEISHVEGFSFHTIYIKETACEKRKEIQTLDYIENQYYRIKKSTASYKGYELYIKNKDITIDNFIYLEEAGDEGDNYDYSNPTKDMKLYSFLADTTYICYTCEEKSYIEIRGMLNNPKDLNSRAMQNINNEDPFTFIVELTSNSHVISIKGEYDNHAVNHRVRLVVRTPYASTHSLAGTQFGAIHRENEPTIMKQWKKEGWLEEPTPIYPLLNYVMTTNDNSGFGVYTKSSKEYEMIADTYNEIAITLFRSVGYLGLPDLNRRPGRASGIAEKIIPSPRSQMKGINTFELGVFYTSTLNMNDVVNKYNEYAVDPCYYQNQKFNRIVYPISYFQTNPLKQSIPDSYSLQVNKELANLSFSTFEKINGKKIMRIFQNNEQIKLNKPINKYDLFGTKIDISCEIREGEIINTNL